MAKDKSFVEIKRDIDNNIFAPVYLFQGEEPYFIDQLTDALIDKVLDESERDFNQTLVYGSETNAPTVINACKRYPMMAERQLVVVKEAQAMKDIYDLIHYVKSPLLSTVLIINFKYGKLDGRKPLGKEINNIGVSFESKKYYDNQIPGFIVSYLQNKSITIEPKAAQLLTDYLGADLSKLTNELDKLALLLPAGNPRITPLLIEQNIGISKDYNNFELQKAIANRDVLKANQIAYYFEHNQKNNPFILSLNVLFNFFANLMICQFQENKSQENVKQVLDLRFDMQAYDYMSAMRNYKPVKTMANISLIREYDGKGKGFNNPGTPPGKLLTELIYKLMH